MRSVISKMSSFSERIRGPIPKLSGGVIINPKFNFSRNRLFPSVACCCGNNQQIMPLALGRRGFYEVEIVHCSSVRGSLGFCTG
jgi:hypothetical protein